METQLTLEKFIASLIKNHRRKFNYFEGYLYLTSKQVYLYNKLFVQRVGDIEKISTWNDGKFTLSKDGNEIPVLHRFNKKLSFTIPTRKKSMSFIKNIDGQLTPVWFNCENGSILTFK